MKIDDAWRNPDGTYNGAKALAKLTGLSEAEIEWTWTRMKALIAEGKPIHEAKTILEEESKGKPWLKS